MRELHLYTDGSHFKGRNGSGRLGIGGVLIDPGLGKGKIITELSESMSQPELTRLFGGNGNLSNPSLEMIAVLYCLREFRSQVRNSDLVVYADYLGVREWMTGAWRTKEPYIKKLKDLIESEVMRSGVESIRYEWVRGHQNPRTSKEAYWNNRADWLAKGRDEN